MVNRGWSSGELFSAILHARFVSHLPSTASPFETLFLRRVLTTSAYSVYANEVTCVSKLRMTPDGYLGNAGRSIYSETACRCLLTHLYPWPNTLASGYETKEIRRKNPLPTAVWQSHITVAACRKSLQLMSISYHRAAIDAQIVYAKAKMMRLPGLFQQAAQLHCTRRKL